MSAAIGLDFGTTNSSIAWIGPDGIPQLASFSTEGGLTESYRSLLYLEMEKVAGRSTIKSFSGPHGTERYLSTETKGRLIQSMKSFLASRTLIATEVFNKAFTLEELIAAILRDIKSEAERQCSTKISTVVVGRPVRFVGANTQEDDDYALGRLRDALKLAGFGRVVYELEPMGAAYHYESTLDHDELILIGDFGGGTSDFSLLRVGPTFRAMARRGKSLLGNEGVGLAGDAFDAKIVRNLVSPALGLGTQIQSFRKLLPVPSWVYNKLERWHHLSLLRNKDTLRMLESVRVQAVEPEKIVALIDLVQADLGFQLHKAVQATKLQLSAFENATFEFDQGGVEIHVKVTRDDFEGWIKDELLSIESCVDRLLTSSKTPAASIDRIFLTGGTSFVPAVRNIFESRFGVAKIQAGNEFTSVARGLALRAARI